MQLIDFSKGGEFIWTKRTTMSNVEIEKEIEAFIFEHC